MRESQVQEYTTNLLMESKSDLERVLDSPVEGEAESRLQTAMSPIEIAWLFWNHRRTVYRVCAVTLVIATLVAFLIPKRYTATARLMPPDYNGGSALMAMAIPALGGQSGGEGGGSSVMGLASQLLGMNSSSDLFVGVLQSQSVEDRLIDEFKLQALYSTTHIEDTRKKLESVTEIQIEKKTGILSISVEDRNPERAAALAQAYVEELNRTLAQVNTSSAHRERLFIEARLKQVKQDLDASSKEFSIFASQNSTINLPDQAKAMVTAAADLQAQLIAAQSELKAVQAIFTDRNVRVREAQARVDELQAQLDKFGGKNVDPVRDSSLAKGELYPSIRQLPLLGVKYLDLYRQNKINEAVYELLTKQYEVAKIQEAREVPSVQVLDRALVPTKKSSPHRLQLMLGGILLGLAIGCGAILANRIWERTDPRDPRRVLVETVSRRFLGKTWETQWGRRTRGGVRKAVTWLRSGSTPWPSRKSRA